MDKRLLYLICLYGYVFCWAGVANKGWGHDDPNASVPSLKALKVNAPLVLDGALDEPFWAEADVASDFIDDRSHKPQSQPTYARIAYTTRYIYVGIECMDDNMEEIHASERREDRFFRGDDWVEVHFDPLHTHRQKYAFYTNPLGTKADGKEGPSGRFNFGWTAEWDCEARMYEDRWVLEMRIPFTIMNFEQRDGQTWGLNFTRQIRSTDSRGFWSFNPTDIFKPYHFGHLTDVDLSDAYFDRNWEVAPYVSSQYDFNGEEDMLWQTGVDTHFRLTPTIITAWTINPDFGQVEADDDTIELRDTERFLEEKRLFFREGEELMRTRRRLYYSRRFSDIDAGSRITGQWRGDNFVFLDIHGEVTHGRKLKGNNAVFRYLQNIGEKNTIGYYLADSEFDEGHSRVAGVDGKFFLTDEWQYNFQGSFADDFYQKKGGYREKDSTDYLGFTSIVYENYPWDIELGYEAITDEFEPALSFIRRQDIFGPSFDIQYDYETDEEWYKEFFVWFDSRYMNDGEGALSVRDFEIFSQLVFSNDMALRWEEEIEYHNPYDNLKTRFGYTLNDSDYWRSLDFDYAFGEFENTDYQEYSVGKRLKPFNNWPIRYEFVVRFEEEEKTLREETVWLNRIVFDYYFTDEMWIKSSIQHRDESVHNISLIYGWEFREQAHWYLVFNSVDEDDSEDVANSIFTKVVYTF
ncbi:hypothetical protein GF373_16635 [bacterium]|nr:hypothetical protein [bacterium]